jgi:hypothetical protein
MSRPYPDPDHDRGPLGVFSLYQTQMFSAGLAVLWMVLWLGLICWTFVAGLDSKRGGFTKMRIFTIVASIFVLLFTTFLEMTIRLWLTVFIRKR